MLLDTMSSQELTGAIMRDWHNATVQHWPRLVADYDRSRRKKKIDKAKAYCAFYDVVTKARNNWLFMLSKAPAIAKYKGTESINILSAVYYYGERGLRVFKISPGGGLHVYNGHLFTRYNERMGLGLKKPVDIVKCFFQSNGYLSGMVFEEEGREYMVSTCSEGFLLGELQHDRQWCVHKTFIAKEQAKGDQLEVERGLVESVQRHIEEELNATTFNDKHYQYLADVMKGMQGKTIII